MPSPAVAERVDRLIAADVRRVDKVITLRDARGSLAARELLQFLEEADANLSRRLRSEARRFGGARERFTGASAEAYRAQIRVVMGYVRSRLGGLTEAQAAAAIQRSVRETARLLEELEERFTGIVTPLRLKQAATLDRVSRGSRVSLLAQHATSVDRYGDAMTQQFERYIRLGMIQGMSQEEMIAALTGHGGPRGRVSMAARIDPSGAVIRIREEDIPEGLFRRYRYWAERIVRTETANAYMTARLDSLRVAREEDFPDMQKKALATFDNRTAPDSIPVHGQIRALDEYFMDGAGRQYLKPPGRPNDRETIIPWRPRWTETRYTSPLPAPQIAEALETNARAGARARQDAAQVTAPTRRERATQRAIQRRNAAATNAAQRTEQRERRAAAVTAAPPPPPPPPPAPIVRGPMPDKQLPLFPDDRKQWSTEETLRGLHGWERGVHPSTQARFAGIVGNNVDPETLNRLASLPPGFRHKNLATDFESHGAKDLFVLSTEIETDRGVYAGKLVRSMYRDTEGRLHVKHDYFVLDDAFKGKRLGSHVLREQYRSYVELGVSEIGVSTAWDGKYVWARMGFQWDDATTRSRTDSLRRYLETAGLGLDRDTISRTAETLAADPYELARFEVGDRRVGKDFLMSLSGWSGVIDFTRGSRSRARYARALGIDE